MILKSYIAATTIAETDKIYEVLWDQRIKMGNAKFLYKEGDLFVFDISLSNKDQFNKIEFKFDVDVETNKLIRLRAAISK